MGSEEAVGLAGGVDDLRNRGADRLVQLRLASTKLERGTWAVRSRTVSIRNACIGTRDR